MSNGDRRSSPRFPQNIRVDLLTRTGRRYAIAADISRHGLFLACADPPPVSHAVMLRVHLDNGPFETMATVVRHGTSVHGGAQGVGVQIFCLGSEAKNRWDTFVANVEGKSGVALPQRPSHFAACFLVQRPTPAALLDFFRNSVMGQEVFYVSPAVPRVGALVAFVLIHPVTHEEFTLDGTVAEFDPARPARMGVRFDPITREVRSAFRDFLGFGDPDDLHSVIEDIALEASAATTAPWTDYALFLPHVQSEVRFDDMSTDVVPLEGHTLASIEGVLLLEDEVADIDVRRMATADLDVIEGALLEHPALRQVNMKDLFDFNWSNEPSGSGGRKQ